MNKILAHQRPKKRRRPAFLIIGSVSQKPVFSPLFRLLGRTRDFAVSSYNSLRHNPLAPKIAGASCAALFITAAVSVVSFAIASPELPPKSLVSTLEDVADYYTAPENSYMSSVVVLPPEDENWVSLTTFDGQESQTGLGAPVTDRTEDIEYRVRPGETLSEIAYSYDIAYNVLAFYNKIINANRIRVGTVIKIPSLDHEKAAAQQMQRQSRQAPAPAARVSARTVKIDYESHYSGAGGGVTVQFSILDPPEESFQSFEWEFGDGKRGFRPNPSYEYSDPKTYVARLTARDTAGNIYRSNPLYIDIPHPGSAAEHSTTKFVTLSSPDEYFVINGVITQVARYPSVEMAPLDLSESDQFLTKVRFTRPGFYGLTVKERGYLEQYYSVFVSPMPTMHADAVQESFNWYRTQYNTGTTSNCGPASVSMAIGWALGKYFPVSSVRQAVGWQGDGGTSFEELQRVLREQGVESSILPLRTVQNIKDVVDSGSIAIVLFRTDGVRTTRADPASDLVGKYYNDSVGHYIVIKGYSLNGEYFVIYDPIPSDWGANSFRYGDEVSMMGRNRYFSAAEVLRSLRRADMIVVAKQ